MGQNNFEVRVSNVFDFHSVTLHNHYRLDDMTNEETSLTKDADAGSVVSSKQHHVKAAFASFNGLEKGSEMRDTPDSLPCHVQPTAAEEQDCSPVSSVGVDAFELVGLMFVASGDMSETRVRRAVENVRQAVQR